MTTEKAPEMCEFGTREAALVDAAPGPGQLEGAQAPVSLRLKRLTDIVGAILLTIFLMPLLVATTVAVKSSSPGPVIFTQMRTGRGGAPFRIWKFRTMHVMEDAGEVVQAERNDTRLTPIGGFLRRTSIDELPQLINVIKGDMSLVGPRPHAIAHDEQFSQVAPDYYLRFRMRPGITGLAQISGHRGSIVSTEQIIARVACDNAYIDDWSLKTDLKILVKTVLGVPFHRAF